MIAVVNGKGGVGKTPATAMLAATFARFGGGGVLAWDNSETVGTLGWRTEGGPRDVTVTDLVPAAQHLLRPGTPVSEIAAFVHHQTHDRYDVLRSSTAMLGAKARISAEDFDTLLQVAARYYRMVIFDSGKDEAADRWMRMIDSVDQLVIPLLANRESAECVAVLLEELADRDEHGKHLAENAVVVVNKWHDRIDESETREVVDGLSKMARSVVVMPFDKGLKSGPLRFDNLRPATQNTWIKVAAEAARGLPIGAGRVS